MDTQVDKKSREVTVSEEGLYKQQITLGDHTILADEPISAGGKDLGPSPYELLLASLGACTSITVRMYADFKKIPLEKIIVHLCHEKIYRDDCQHCENANSKIDRINIKIQFQGNLSQDQRNKLIEIANHCPVHRTLTSETHIISQLVD
ncbi:MAG: OsmC family protein [Gammaproteobacteria bacterium]